MIRPASGPLHSARIAAAKQRQSSIDWPIVRALRKRYDAGEYQTDLAAEFGLSKHHVYRVVNRLSWKEAPTSSLATLAQQAGML